MGVVDGGEEAFGNRNREIFAAAVPRRDAENATPQQTWVPGTAVTRMPNPIA